MSTQYEPILYQSKTDNILCPGKMNMCSVKVKVFILYLSEVDLYYSCFGKTNLA